VTEFLATGPLATDLPTLLARILPTAFRALEGLRATELRVVFAACFFTERLFMGTPLYRQILERAKYIGSPSPFANDARRTTISRRKPSYFRQLLSWLASL
jgi:hypothetical protein